MAAVLSLANSKRSFGEAIARFPTRLPAREQSRTVSARPGQKIAWRISPACAGFRQADSLPHLASLTSMCNRVAEKTKAGSESELPEARAKYTPTLPVARFALSVSYPL